MRTSRRCGAHLGDPPILFSLSEFGFDFSEEGSKEEADHSRLKLKYHAAEAGSIRFESA